MNETVIQERSSDPPWPRVMRGGIAALKNKIVQQAVVMVLKEVYEEDFLGFSCGFRPGRSQHDALDALCVGIMRKKVNWILDVDVRSFLERLHRPDWRCHASPSERICLADRRRPRISVRAIERLNTVPSGTPSMGPRSIEAALCAILPNP